MVRYDNACGIYAVNIVNTKRLTLQSVLLIALIHLFQGTGVTFKMASNHSEQQPNVHNLTFVLGGANRGRAQPKIKIVQLHTQATSDEQARAEQRRKEKLKQHAGN